MKKLQLILSQALTACFANDVDALIPELWANEALLRLEKTLVMGNLVHRDYSDEIANFGDVVNTHRPSEFISKRKDNSDSVTVQDVNTTNLAVRLDQHHHVSFLLKDGEEAKSFKDLVEMHLVPAAYAISDGIDQAIFGQAYDFLGNSAGKLGVDPSGPTITALRTAMTNNKAPMGGRNLVMSPDVEGVLLNIDNFITADKVGDEGSALREGSLGRKYGFQMFTSHNAPSVSEIGANMVTADVNNVGGYPAGTTTIDYDNGSSAFSIGGWISVAGDDQPLKIVGDAAGTLTVSPATKYAIADNAEIKGFEPALINNLGGYPLLHSKDLIVDGGSTPQLGQLATLGATNYGLVNEVSATNLILNNSLQTAAADNDVLGLGPAGNYAFGFNRNAIALVTRPLPTPKAGTGAASAVVSDNGLGMRVTITYDGNKQGHLVTFDLLAGVATLDTNLGSLMLG